MANTTWEPERFANLNKLLSEGIELGNESPRFEQLKKQLDKLKPDLASLLVFPAKNTQHRAELEKGTPTINGEQFKVSSDFISETKKLSDFLDIDEDLAATLVHKAVGFEKRFELAAGESAVLLYYSEREAKLMSLRTLFAGGASQEVEETMREELERHTSEILSSTLKAESRMFPERVLRTIDELNTKQERMATVLSGPTADIPYSREVVEFAQSKLGEERRQLAMLLFVIVRDYQLNSGELIAVVGWLRGSNVADAVTLHLAVTLLVALDTAAEGSSAELGEAAALDKISHLVRDSQFLVKLNAEIVEKAWNDEGLKGLVWLQWALLALFGMKRSPGFDQLIGYREDRVETIAEQAIRMGAYRFATDYLLGHRITDDLGYELSAEFEVLQRQHSDPATTAPNSQIAEDSNKAATPARYPHFSDISDEFQWHIEHTLEDILSALIGRMSSLIRRMRYSEEDAIYQAQQLEEQRQLQEQQRQQSDHGPSRVASDSDGTSGGTAVQPRRDTEALFLWITLLYAERPDAGLRFWGGSLAAGADLDDRMAVFLRWGSDCREQGMVRGYFNMLASLACGSQASASAHEFLSGASSGLLSPRGGQAAANQAPLCSWAALFGALEFYAGHMKASDPDPLTAAAQIPDAEEALLRAFLRLCRTVVHGSAVARTALFDSTEFNAAATLFRLLGCAVPVALKAALLDTIAAFGAADDDAQTDAARTAAHGMARRVWELLEDSQTLPTRSDTTARRGLAVGRGGGVARARGGIVFELEEIEASAETYAETRAFVRLVAALVHTSSGTPGLANVDRDPLVYAAPSPSLPTNLGNEYRVPGIGPYVSFVLDSVLLKAEQRSYLHTSEKWRVYASALDVVERCLATLDLRTAGGGDAATQRDLVTHPGFEIAVRVLCGSRLLDVLLHVAGVGVDALNAAAGGAVEAAIGAALRILLRVLRLQGALLRDIIPALVDAPHALGFPLNLPRSLAPLEQLLLPRREAVVQLVALVGATSSGVCLAAVRIVQILADSTAFNGIDDSLRRGAATLTLNRLVGIVDASADSVRILHAFIGCLESEDAAAPQLSADARIGDAARGFTSGLDDQPADAPAQAVPAAVVDLLLANISPTKPAPTIAHYLLGFSLANPASDDLPDPSQRATCLHAVLDLLRRDASGLATPRPRLVERCYHLVARLCADPVTSDVTMRYLRARENFFYTQLSTMSAAIVPDLQLADVEAHAAAQGVDVPALYSPIHVYAQMHARAWLWRSSALELHNLVLQDSRARAKLIGEWLVGDAGQGSGAADDGDVFGAPPGAAAPSFLDARMRLLSLFEGLRQAHRDAAQMLRRQQHAAESEYLGDAMPVDGDDDESPAREAEDAQLLGVDVQSCVVTNARGCAVVDLRALVALLRDAERALDSSGALGSAAARQRVHAAIRRLVIRCYFGNQERELFFAYASALRAWTELVEIVVTSAWDKLDAGGRVGRERTAFQLLRALAQVVAEHDPLLRGARAPAWLTEPPSAAQELRHAEVLAALASTLALCAQRLSSEWTRAGVLARASLAANKPGIAGQSRALPPATDSRLPVEPLLDAWRLLTEAALTPAAQASLQLRGNIYASMLHFLGGVRKLAAAADAAPTTSGNAASGSGTAHILGGPATRRARSRLLSGALDVLANSTLGDRLLETVSADAADASDAWKTVAFSLLDSIAVLYGSDTRSSRVVLFLARKNFFSSYVGAIVRREDHALQATLQPDPASLNALYIYEAKMSFFIRLALRQDGAEKLVENGILDVLADCSFLHLRPSASSDNTSSFADAFVPARAERFHQLLMPALDLLLTLVPRIGRDHITVWMKAARFVSQHYGVLEAILKDAASPNQPLSIALLTEVKAVTMLAFSVARQRAVLDREAALAGSGHVGITALHLPILALLPKFSAGDWVKRLLPANDVERAQTQVPAALFDDEPSETVTAADTQRSVFGQQASELVDSIVQNAVAYAQAVTEQPLQLTLSGDGAGRAFRPAFSWPIEHSRESDFTPSLATLVAFVRRSLTRINRGQKARAEKTRLAQHSAEMTTADLRRLINASPYVELSDDLGTQQMRALAEVLLAQQGRRIASSVAILVITVEQALVLLWRHLSFFVASDVVEDSYHGVGGGKNTRLPASLALPSSQERESLRSDASIALPPLFTLLSEIKLTDEFANAGTHISFIQMLVRRIKDLVLRDVSVA
ncbi:hypothetical protein H4R24_004871 [Coemansia sp. RSA 988]|nr:hypothetical protein H4R24_004871 [Coemansia sp. RSA 988]